MVGYRQTNQKTDTGKTLTRWPVFVDHFSRHHHHYRSGAGKTDAEHHHRPYIDQLRGALPYHKAIRGTLITTGKFAAKCAEAALFPGAAPITLIDGDRLLELLIENNVGIRRSNAVELLDVDLQLFDELEIES
jgi:hypothetical protein